MNRTTITYNDKIVRWFLWASVIFAIVGLGAGVLAALQLNISHEAVQSNGFLRKIAEFVSGGSIETKGISYITFGRLRPLHTNAAIFAFIGNMMFAGVYYSTQRLCKCRVASDKLSWFHFWTWQIVIVAAAITLPLGLTQGKEYAELIWPIDILVAISWLAFGYNFFWTLRKRNEPNLYVALWFYIATIITVTMLYVVNNLQIPTSWTHSYPVFGGVQDALVQWWYGHNAVAFFLTTPILGIMYYFLPKAANRPVYSYRLSIIHFWSLVFIYIWAGPHHLLNTALPGWLQILGMLFSVMLWAPSWGGMLNGLLTLRGAWGKLHHDPVIKFFAAALTFYGMATFEGPLLSIKSVNALSHYTDWTVGHVHSGTLGWNGFMAAGMFYFLVPRLWKTELYSKSLANTHFWVGFVGILLYVSSMWVSGITQGLMHSAAENGRSVHLFVDTLHSTQLMKLFRSLGGILYLLGFILCVYNLFMTCRKGKATDATAEVVIRHREDTADTRVPISVIFKEEPVAAIAGIVVALIWWILNPDNYIALALMVGLAFVALKRFRKKSQDWDSWHMTITKNYLPFTVMVLIGAGIGGAVQIIPSLLVNKAANVEDRLQTVYTPLELAGRDIYISEGCYNCHSQMIRMMDSDVIRYGGGAHDDLEKGGYSRLGESIYDHPFQWGSMRTGPDLAREGGDYSAKNGDKVTDKDGEKELVHFDWDLIKRGDLEKDKKFTYMRKGIQDNLWHYRHLMNPRDVDVKSNMPSYSNLVHNEVNFKQLPKKIKVQVQLGVPYPAMDKHEIEQHAQDHALEIAKNLVKANADIPWVTDGMSKEEIETRLAKTEMVALIAYLQKIGVYDDVKDLKAKEAKENKDKKKAEEQKDGWKDPDHIRSRSEK